MFGGTKQLCKSYSTQGMLITIGLVAGILVVALYVGYIFADIYWVIIIKHNNLFCNLVLNFCLEYLVVELCFFDIVENIFYVKYTKHLQITL